MKINATPVVLLVGALWVVVTLMGMFGLWSPALLLSLVLMVAYLVLGSAHKGRIDLDAMQLQLLPVDVKADARAARKTGRRGKKPVNR